MSQASDLPIKFPVKSSQGNLSLVLPRRRPASRPPFAAVNPGEKNEAAREIVRSNETDEVARGLLEAMRHAQQEREIQLADRERLAGEQEKRLAQREHDLVQAEGALWHAIEALQKIKSAFHARRD